MYNNKIVKSVFSTKFLLMLPFFIIALILIIVPTIIIIVYAFVPHYNLGEAANWKVMTLTTWQIIGWTLLTSLATTFICIILGFPFAYLLSLNRGKIFKAFALLVITSPIWSSTLFKLIGLSTMFDILNGAINSTYGDQYTILGYVYIFLPLMILPIYQVLEGMPNNYVLASQDLGAGKIKTFFKIVLPYTKNALLSGITLVFIPSMMIISVSAYMNNASNSQLLGGLIYSQGSLGLDNKLSLSRASVISIVSVAIILALWFLIVKVPKWIKLGIKKLQAKTPNSNYYTYSFNYISRKEKKRLINSKLKRVDFYFEKDTIQNVLENINQIKVVNDLTTEEELNYYFTNYKKNEQTQLYLGDVSNDILNKGDVAIKE